MSDQGIIYASGDFQKMGTTRTKAKIMGINLRLEQIIIHEPGSAFWSGGNGNSYCPAECSIKVFDDISRTSDDEISPSYHRENDPAIYIIHFVRNAMSNWHWETGKKPREEMISKLGVQI